PFWLAINNLRTTFSTVEAGIQGADRVPSRESGRRDAHGRSASGFPERGNPPRFPAAPLLAHSTARTEGTCSVRKHSSEKRTKRRIHPKGRMLCRQRNLAGRRSRSGASGGAQLQRHELLLGLLDLGERC